jgi:hypothetical protein
MTSATRRAVQTSPRKPYASAPFAKSWGICAFCSSVKRSFIPCGGCALRASTPCSRPRQEPVADGSFAHTPSATAISFCFQPCSFKLQARLRRSSRQSAFLGAPMPPSLQHLYFLLPRSVIRECRGYRAWGIRHLTFCQGCPHISHFLPLSEGE